MADDNDDDNNNNGDDDFFEKVGKLIEDFEKKAIPAIEKKLNDAGKKVEKKVNDIVDQTKRDWGTLIKGSPSAGRGQLPQPPKPPGFQQDKKEDDKNKPGALGGLFQNNAARKEPLDPNYDVAKAAKSVIDTFKKQDVGQARREGELLIKHLNSGKADINGLAMEKLVSAVTDLHVKRNREIVAARAASWVKSLVALGADMSNVDAEHSRNVAEKQIEKNDLARGRKTLAWSRFVEQAVANSLNNGKNGPKPPSP